MRPTDNSSAGLLAAVPWCCLVPAGFALLGLAGAGAARGLAADLWPLLMGLTLLFLGRAHWALHVRHQGNRWSRRIVWMATLLAVSMWVFRLR